MRLCRIVKDKIDEIIIKAYVKFTVKMWEIEDMMKDTVSELKDYVKR